MEFLIIPVAIASIASILLITGTDNAVEINDIVPHPTYQDLGYDETALTNALMVELRRLIFAADNTPGAPVLDMARENTFTEDLAEMIGIESIVNRAREVLGEIHFTVNAQFTEFDGENSLNVAVLNVYTSQETILRYTFTDLEPTLVIHQFARDLLLLIDPYVLALDSFAIGREINDFSETIQLIDYGLAEGPDDLAHRYHNLRGLVHSNLGEHADALQSYDVALITGSDDIYAHFNRVITLGQLDRVDEMTDELLAITSGEADWVTGLDVPRSIIALAYLSLASIAMEGDNDQEAIGLLRQSIDADSLIPQTHSLLAEIFRRNNLDLLAPYHERTASRLLTGGDDISVETLLDNTAEDTSRFSLLEIEERRAIEESDMRGGSNVSITR